MVLVALGALVLAQFSSSSDPRRTFAAGDKDAVLMLPPETVCNSEVSEMAWTADGSALAVVRSVVDLGAKDMVALAAGGRPSPEALARVRPRVELILWSVASRKARLVSTVDASRGGISGLRALPGSDRIVVESTGYVTNPDGSGAQSKTISLLSAATGVAVTLDSSSLAANAFFDLSPTRPIGFLTRLTDRRSASAVRFFGPAGRLGVPVALPPGAHMTFGNDGLPGFITMAETGGKRIASLHKVDPATGRETGVVPFVFEPDAKPKVDALGMTVLNGNVGGAVAPALFLTVEGGKRDEAGVVTTDGSRGLLSPKGDAIAYVCQGSAMVRLLARVPRKLFDDARLAAERSVAMSNAKQAALGLIMYAGDTDDTFPASGDYDKIEPYLKNSTIMNSFTYTYAGGKMTDIAEPASTEIGYVSGPGGRAVAYADGHVRWIPDAP